MQLLLIEGSHQRGDRLKEFADSPEGFESLLLDQFYLVEAQEYQIQNEEILHQNIQRAHQPVGLIP